MDSVTQFALGAAVSTAVLGPRIGAPRAMLLGGVLGTLPDLDSLLPAADPVAAFTTHRGATHSLLVQAAVTPLFAEPLVRLFQGLKDKRVLTYAAVYLVFATHALIDAMTVYGTQLFWPLWPEPLGVGSIFIIDPLYTLPLLVVVIWALFVKAWTARFQAWVRGALAVTTLYMALTVPVQTWIEGRAERLLADQGVTAERLMAIPAPFTILYWKAIAVDGERYLNIYVPVFGGDDGITTYAHPRHTALGACLADDPSYEKLARFTDGFFRFEMQGNKLVMADLRMGLTPNYVFRFALARETADGLKPLDRPTRERRPRGTEGDWDWIFKGVTARAVTRPAEASAQVDPAAIGPGQVRLAQGPCKSGQTGWADERKTDPSLAGYPRLRCRPVAGARSRFLLP